MEKRHKISQYRERLDKTLASHDLTNEKTIKSLVKDQLLSVSSQNETEGNIENILERRTTEVSYFLDMLRSVSVSVNEGAKARETSRAEWKLKQDTEEFRVMYREGPEGTPFHTLLVEGYVDGPIDACLCVSWETPLYKKWWPQYNIPSFKIISCQCLQKVRIGEEISLVRVKVSWPLSAREALVHYFAFDYFQDDMIIVLMNTISDLKSIDKSTHGFSRDGIPEAKDMVRIDLVGGFALQKVSQERSYFRTIVNMDMKLDFAPPSLINFISRQLVGSGFKLYQKAVASIAKNDEDFSKALRDPLYERIRKALYCSDKINGILEAVDVKSETRVVPEEQLAETIQDEVKNMDQMVPENELVIEPPSENAPIMHRKALGEIEEEEIEKSKRMVETIQEGVKNMDEMVPENELVIEPPPENAPIMHQKALGEIEEDEIEESKHLVETIQEDVKNMDEMVPEKELVVKPPSENASIMHRKGLGEIEEEEIEESKHLEEEEDNDGINHYSASQIEEYRVSEKIKFCLSPDVEQALGTLEKAISMVRELRKNSKTRLPYGFADEKYTINLEKDSVKNSPSSEDGRNCSDDLVEASKQIVERTSDEPRKSSGIYHARHMGSNSDLREVNHNRIAPGSPQQQDHPISGENSRVASFSSVNVTTEAPMPEKTPSYKNERDSIEVNGIHKTNSNGEKRLNRPRKNKLCCMHFFSGK